MLDTEQTTDQEWGRVTDTAEESPWDAATRMLEMAAQTAERLVQDAERQRAEALAALADEKAVVEAQIEQLRQQAQDHRDRMRRELTEQLEKLDALRLEPPDAP
jgi:cell division septum initiation protein DivIVA